ncbi:amino acid adenylation domain-containing protein [Pleionea sediminis]|uniref:amino acid adenylation domain-containing protein n=1 Tax=Pleionea sediminis TaxID=2569479 RepID=UPI0011863AE9|nr:amino acid adenylation domain-containing protein [Pleionea sediminis]
MDSLNSSKIETVCELIEKHWLQHPEKVAIVDGETDVDYERLVKRSHSIAIEIKRRGIAHGSLVGVCMNRSWELIATLLGVMRAGCAYLPLDPAYPQDRVQYMLDNSQAAASIVDTTDSAKLCEDSPQVLWLDKIKDTVNESELEFLNSSTQPSANDLAYIIYTSGSTGRPKGVAIEHHSVVTMTQAVRELFDDDDLNGVLAAASICFDTSVMEIFGTLSLGGTVILAKNALQLPHLPALDRVRTCVMVASSMQTLLATEFSVFQSQEKHIQLPTAIRCLVFGGEALKRSLVDQIHACNSEIRVFNAYGPTEDTVFSTITEIKPGTQVVTIGQSVKDSRAYILDNAMQPVTKGAEGELYLSGNKLARGYLFDEKLTKERFIEKEPSELIPETRLYKTGDLCRETNDGKIEFIGRVDQQVKIRGFRIELEEIESTLESMPGVDAAAAAAIDGGIGQKILAVFVVCHDAKVTDNSIKDYLMHRLPKYMVPQVVNFLKELPVLPNDKLDRKKLISLDVGITKNSSVNELSSNDKKSNELMQQLFGNNIEKQATLLSIIQREIASILNVHDAKELSPEETFSSLGIDSLTSLELACRLTNLIGRDLPSNIIYEYPTPNALVDYIIDRLENNFDSQNPENSHRNQSVNKATNTLASFQSNIQSSHPTFQAAKANAWSATDKSVFVQEVMTMVNSQRRNPYSKVIRTGSSSRGLVSDMYNDEEQEAIIWTTNLYLGLNRDETVIENAVSAVKEFGTGMGTSAAASGLTDLHLEFEKEFAELTGKPSACLFPTGYTANVGAVAGLLGKDDVVVIDQLCHASIVDGARLCGATIRTFQHNNAADLEAVLESEASPYRTILVVLEGVYSMGEGAAPVADILHTAKKYNALTLVDEAHSFGFYGEGGAGICAEQGVTEQADFIMTTLSKALGSLGGVVSAKQEYVDLLRSSSRAFIFQASVSPADIAAALTSLRRLKSDEGLRKRLWETTRYMRQRFEEAGYDLGTGDGPIVTPHFGDKDKLFAIVQALYKRGIQTSAVTYPIVENGRGRLRLICSAAHTKDDVDKTLAALIEAEREVDAMLETTKAQLKPVTKYPTRELKEKVEQWTINFSKYLKQVIRAELTENSNRFIPDLAITIKVSEQCESFTIVINDGKVALSNQEGTDLPTCTLLLSDEEAVNALSLSDVQSLLKSIGKGAVTLNGQTEPFIWFIAKMVEQRKLRMEENTPRSELAAAS